MLNAEQMKQEGERWIASHQAAWTRMRETAAFYAQRGIAPRINALVENERSAGVSVPNDIRAYLSRKIEQEYDFVNMTKARSKVDALFTEEEEEQE